MANSGLCLFLLLPMAYFLLGSTPLEAQVHVRTATFSPVELTYEELYEIIAKSRHIANSAASGHQNYDKIETLTLPGIGVSLKIDYPFAANDLKDAPRLTYGMSYRLEYYKGFRDELISVDLVLSDYDRNLTVSGLDVVSVEALFSLLHDEVPERTHWAGGSTFRSWSGLMLWIIVMFSLAVAVQVTQRPLYHVYLVLMAILMPVILLALPWEHRMPGVLIYEYPKTFFESYQFALYLFAIIAPIFLNYFVEKVRGAAPGRTPSQSK